MDRKRIGEAMTEDRSDPRALRTRAALKEAFSTLSQTVGIDKITVKALTEVAGINRKTFYLHYDAIEDFYDDVMNAIMDDFFENYETTPNIPEDIPGHARRFLLFLTEQDETIEELICLPSFYDFGERIYRTQMSRYKQAGNPFDWLSSGKEELVLSFIRNTALDFYRQWVRGGKAIPPEEAADLLAQLTFTGVEALMR